MRTESLPYYKPQISIVGSTGGQAIAAMEKTIEPSEGLYKKRRRNVARKTKAAEDGTMKSNVLPYQRADTIADTAGSAVLELEQTLPSPGAIPQRRQRIRTAEDSRKERAKDKTKTARTGKRAIRWKRLAFVFAFCAMLGLFGWYMLEGRYSVVSVFDDGFFYSVRTKEATVGEMLTEAGIAITAEDRVSATLEEKPQEGMTVSIARARNISIAVDDGQSASARLPEGTVEDALNAAGIAYGENDMVIPSLDTPIRTDMDIQVYRAKNLYIKTQSKTIEVILGLGTVGDALTKAGIAYDDGDEISPSADTAISDGMEISFMAVEIKQKSHTETIEYDTVYKNSNQYYYGQRKVSQSGKNGTRTIVEEITYEDGKEVSRKVISNKVTKEAVDKIILVGCKPTSNPAIKDLPAGGPTDDLIAYSVVMTQITAYTHSGSRTANGKWPTVGMCAIDRNVFQYGMVFYVPGYGYAVAEDTGSGVGDPYSMGVVMEREAGCLRGGGRRNVTVYVLK